MIKKIEEVLEPPVPVKKAPSFTPGYTRPTNRKQKPKGGKTLGERNSD